LDDTLYLYGPNDDEFPARIIEIHSKFKGKKQIHYMVAEVVSGEHKGAQFFVYENGNLSIPGWEWSQHRLCPITANAVVEVENWERKLKCRVLGYAEGLGGWRGHDFVYECISPVSDRDLGKLKGFRFVGSTELVKRIVRNNTKRRRLVRTPFLTESDMRDLFPELYA
jgi:hypothetical protein